MPSDAQSIIPASHLDLLTTQALAHVATIGPDGAPQSSPVWFDWDGSRLLIGLAQDRQKLRNLRREPRVAVSIVDPTNPIRYLEVRGPVTFEEDPNREILARLVHKYTGSDDLSWVEGERVIAAIEPARTSHQG
jgi:PPOX class probable F420-dependent enzyme